MARALVAPSGTACRAPTGESATPNRTISRYAEDLGSRRIAASAQAGMPVLLKGKRAGRMPALQGKKRQGNGAGRRPAVRTSKSKARARRRRYERLIRQRWRRVGLRG